MPDTPILIPAKEMAAKGTAHWPHESPEYRAARNTLVAEEIELRRHIERVAAMRRALPPGGEIPKDFDFIGEQGPTHFNAFFDDKDTLMIYSMMFGPQRKGPCPMCTSFLSSWNGTAINLKTRVAMAVIARSPIERLIEYKQQRGFTNLLFFSDPSGDFTRTYVSAEDADVPGFTIFTRRDGKIRHFYSGEFNAQMRDPGQDPRGAPDPDPLWLMLDYTPEGRGKDWYPKLSYDAKE